APGDARDGPGHRCRASRRTGRRSGTICGELATRMKTYEYFHIHDDRIEVDLDGIALLRLTLTNKGTAYTLEERRALRLEGLLPPAVSTLDQQGERIRIGFWKQPTPILKYQFLRQLQDRMEVLFYAFLARYLNDTLPIVYTPTVGEAVQKFSAMYQT